MHNIIDEETGGVIVTPISINQVDVKKQYVFYITEKNTKAKLQRIASKFWAFVYLNRIELGPVFIRESAEASIRDACKKQEVFCGSEEEMNQLFKGKVAK